MSDAKGSGAARSETEAKAEPSWSPAMLRFLDALEKTPREWFVWRSGQIRWVPQGKECCPITATMFVAHSEFFPAHEFFRAGRALGLDVHEIAEIVNAADDDKYGDGALRQRLLRACGLEEKP